MTNAALAGATAPAAGPTQGHTIDHGTPRGYRQHRRQGIPTCEPCLDAIREDNRKYRQPANDAQKTWNKGKTGTPADRDTVPMGRECQTTGCGELAEVPQPAAHMVRVKFTGSREPARWYCAAGCAAYGLALAEIRAIDNTERADAP